MCFCIKKVLGEISKYSQIYINFDRFHLFYVQNYSSNSLLMLKYDGLRGIIMKNVATKIIVNRKQKKCQNIRLRKKSANCW